MRDITNQNSEPKKVILSKISNFWKNNPIFNKILFEKKINKVINLGVRNYFKDLFIVKNIFLKILMICILVPLVLGLGFGLREHFLNIPFPKAVINTGIAFSGLAEIGKTDPSVVYVVQAIPIIIAFFCLLLIPKWYVAIGFTMMFFGGLTNIIDRSIPKTFTNHWGTEYVNQTGVLDYFMGINSIFNMPDVFIIGGVVLGLLGIVIWVFISIGNDKKKETEEKNQKQLENPNDYKVWTEESE